MATHYSANQYQSAFNSANLQNWTVPKPYKERPSTHDGFTQFVANDRGHLLPGVPRTKANPWGTFMGTWDMPLKIPPAKLSLTARSADASKRLTQWIEKSDPLISACNGLRLTVTGKVCPIPFLSLSQFLFYLIVLERELRRSYDRHDTSCPGDTGHQDKT
ncbi:PREDICTED: protein Flattop [Nanorana parkeri]|uniref:protein Flattop n=1 Tax=Nanorana parkeri TaxID=125878 RepID=UPI0008541AD2|nr:PREDICTED: protein Flattop [Nanorana parkeri]